MNNPIIDQMFKVGAHFGYTKSRRHPTVAPYIFGSKNKVEIVDLEQTAILLEKAKDVVRTIAEHRGQILFVASKPEGQDSIKKGAEAIEAPYVAGRWIGGTFTNFGQIRKRVMRLEDLTAKRDKGELGMYTKRERLMIGREIENLERFFFGLIPMKDIPKAIFVIDSRREHIAVAEAKKAGVPVIALCGSDCNLKEVDYAVVGNDASRTSIDFFVSQIVQAYKEGLLKAPVKSAVKKESTPERTPDRRPASRPAHSKK